MMFVGFIAILVLELGHAVEVRRCGARVIEFCAGPLAYNFEISRWVKPRWQGKELGGYVTFVFDHESKETRKRHASIAAAGPLANIIIGVLLFAAASVLTEDRLMLPPISVAPVQSAATIGAPLVGLPSEAAMERIWKNEYQRRRSKAIKGLAEILAILSFAMAAFNLLPFAGSDGQRILRELRN